MPFRSEERKAEKQREREAAAAEKERRKQERANEERQRAFAKSPAGRARAAFDRGDDVFQFELDARRSETYTIPMWKTGAISRAEDGSAVLNSIAREGWRLVNGSFVFHETGAESRDKFMASGQHVAVQGTIVGYYLFARDEALRRSVG